jgi:hypothetical protein
MSEAEMAEAVMTVAAMAMAEAEEGVSSKLRLCHRRW